MAWQQTIYIQLGICCSYLWLASCSSGGSDSKPQAAPSSVPYQSLSGSLKGPGSAQNEMAGWLLVATERDTGVARVAEISASGTYQLADVQVDKAQSLTILAPSYRYSSTLSYPGATPGTIRQFFTVSGANLPTLVYRGGFLTMTHTEGVTFSTDYASDSDGDGIPNGVDSSPMGFRLGPSPEPINKADTDNDSVINDLDPDIDGDGIFNCFDNDDDGDGIPDIFDTDADGNNLPDATEITGDLHFKKTVDYLTIQLIQDISEDQGVLTISNNLSFTIKIKRSVSARGVRIRGPEASLLNNSQALLTDSSTGKSSGTVWDRTLLDDGLSEDANAADGVYGRRVSLEKGKTVKGGQVIFFAVDSLTAAGATITEYFPYTFPAVTAGAIKATWAQDSNTVTMVGTPFEGIDRSLYRWSVQVITANGQKVYSSEPISAKTETYKIPMSLFSASDEKYRAMIVAESTDRVPGYPNWIIRSPYVDLK